MTTRVAGVCFGKKKPQSSLEHANQSAANLSKSQYGYAITNKNPFDDRQLEQTLRNIEKEQRLKSTEMFWKQRQFFIEKAFDEDDKLRFAKLKSEKSDKKLQLPDIQIKTPSSRSSSGSSSENPKQRKKVRMSSAFFPKIVEEETRPVTSYKKSKMLKKQKTLVELKNRSDLIPSPMFGTSPDFKSGNDESLLRDNPVLLPMKDNMSSDGQQTKKKKKKKSRKNSYDIPELTDNMLEICEKENYYQNCSMPIREKLRLAEVDDDALLDFVQNNEELKLDFSSMASNDDSRASKSKSLSQSTTSLTTDELLLKLTKSLPMRLLLKTDETLNNLSSALGFDEQRNKLIQREKSIISRSALEDDRFKKLMDSLAKQNVNLEQLNNLDYLFF